MTHEPVDEDKGENNNFGNQNLSMKLFSRENSLTFRRLMSTIVDVPHR